MQWVIVGVAVGVLPTYVLMSERVKKESDAASATAASAAAASVYAAWNAAPKPVCSAQPITMPTVVAVTQAGGGAPRPVHASPANHASGGGGKEEGDDNGSQMLMQMMPMMQGMMNDNGSGAPAGSGMPDMTELMKNMPKK